MVDFNDIQPEQLRIQKRTINKLMKKLVLTTSIIVALSFATSSYAQLTTTTYADQAAWNTVSANGFAQIDQTTLTPQAAATVNSGAASAGISNNIFSQTFTPTTTFTLGAFS